MNHTAMTVLTSRLPQRRESSRIPGPNQNSSHHQNISSFPVIKKFGSLVRPNFLDNSSGNITSSSSTNSNQSINQFPAHQQQAQNHPPSLPSIRSSNDDRTTDNPSDSPSISGRGLRSSRINSQANSISFQPTAQIGSNRINPARPNFSAKYVPSPTLPTMNTINHNSNEKNKSRSSSVREDRNLDLNDYSQRSQSTSSSHDKSSHLDNRFDSRLGLSNSCNSNSINDSNRPSPALGLSESETLKRSLPRPLIHPKPVSTSLKNSSSSGNNESSNILPPKICQSNSTSYHANMIPPMVSSMSHPSSSVISSDTTTNLSRSVHSSQSTSARGQNHQSNSNHQATILRRPSSGIPRTGSIRDTLPARNVQPERKISLNIHGSGKDYRRSCSPIDMSLVCPENMIPAKSESNVARVSPIMRTIRHQPSNTNSLGTISVVTSSSSTSSTSPSCLPGSSSVVSNGSESNSSSTTSMTTVTTASKKEDRMENDGKETHSVSNGLNLSIKEHSAKILAHKNAPSNATSNNKGTTSLSSCTLSSSASTASTTSSCSFSPHPSFTSGVNKTPTSTTNSVSVSNGNQKMFLRPVIEECTTLNNGKISNNNNNNNDRDLKNDDKIKYSTAKSRPNWSHKSNYSDHTPTIKDNSNRSSSSSMEESESKEINKTDALLNKLKLTETIVDTKPPNQLSFNLYSNHHQRHSIILNETEVNSILGSIKPLPEPRSLSFRSGSTTIHPQSQSTTDSVNQNGLNSSSSSGLNLSLLQLRRLSKTGDLRGSALSLLSNSSSFSASEERHNQEAKKLKEDLNRANIKIETLTSQLKNSNDMITTFNQSLEALRTRLQQSCLTINQKEREISRLKATMEVLRREFQSDTLLRRGGAPCSDIDTRKEKQRKRSKDRTPLSDQEESSNSSWFRGSLTRAFKRTRSRKNSEGSQSDIERSSQTNGYNSNSLPGTPILCPKDLRRSSQSIFTLGDSVSYGSKHDGIESLKKQLRDKDRQLNEIRLEALLTASQMESMNDRLNQMKKEMATLRTENQRLQSALQRQSITSSFGSLTSCSEASTVSNVERKIHLKLLDHLVGLVDITHRTTWRQLDTKIRKIFDQYLRKIDQERLEMSTNCLISYCCGNDGIERQFGLERIRETHTPIEALSRVNHINLCLRSKLEYLAIDTSSPKTILERITTTLKTFRRLVIGGPAHSGKYSLALRCCRFVLEEMGFELGPSSVASIDVQNDGHKEIECFLQKLLGCSVNTHPKGIIFKNIHNISEFSSLLAPLQQVNSSTLSSREFPLILCTLRCADGGPLVTNLKVHFQFQSFLCNRSMEPCKNFIGRILRKKAVDYEFDSINRGSSFDFDAISRIIDWLQQFHHRLNIFIMSFSQCSDDFDTETLLTCPMDIESIHEWFVNSWNFQIVPKVREMISNQTQSLDLNSFHDPSNWILEGYPWNPDVDKTSFSFKLLPIFENSTHTSCTKSRPDPIVDQLHDTLRKLQEVTNG